MSRLSIEHYAVLLARAAAARSEDPYHKVGTALVRPDKTIVALGYNGAVPGFEINWEDRADRREFVVHAEANALRYALPGEVDFVATTMMPCLRCLLTIASYGIKRVVYADELDPAVYPVSVIRGYAEMIGVSIEKLEDS